MKLELRTTCRVCGSHALTTAIDLGPQHLQGSFVKDGCEPPRDQFPTELVVCDRRLDPNGCGLLQMAYSVPTDILYANYWYRSGTNRTMRGHLRRIVEDCVDLLDRADITALDIGCNDGTLLSYYPKTATRFGVDPSDIAETIGSWATVARGVFPSPEAAQTLGDTRFDVVTSIAMFYDLEDPVAFAKAIAERLKDDGVWILEMSYLPLMLEQNSFDTICHEHLEYYSLEVLERILDAADLKAVRAQTNDINGGSIRLTVTHKAQDGFNRNDWLTELHELGCSETEMRLGTVETYRQFQDRIEALRSDLSGLLHDIKERGQTVHIYGASTKGNVLLQWYGIDNTLIPYAAERNPSKVGARTLGSDIEIISEAASREMQPDYYLVLPWHFRAEFLEREKETIFAGTKMIFPLPRISVVSLENYSVELALALNATTGEGTTDTLWTLLEAARGKLPKSERGESNAKLRA
ncbi:MAG: class I SAM-dependent methyltransferase [Pseudomonadota bacterium]